MIETRRDRLDRNWNENRRPGIVARKILPAGVAAVLLISACSSPKSDTRQEGKDSGTYAAARASFDRAIVPIVDSWANETVSARFEDLKGATTSEAENALSNRVAESDSTKNSAALLCQHLNSLQGAAGAGPADERANRIGEAVRYTKLTAKIHVAAAILRRIYASDAFERDRLLGMLVSTDPSDPVKTKAAVDSLRKVGLLGATDEVLTPDAADPRMSYDLGGGVPGFDVVTSYFDLPLVNAVKPCFPMISVT